MLSFLPTPLKALLSTTLFILNTILWCLCIYPFAILKALVPLGPFRQWCGRQMVNFAELWISGNDFNMSLTQKIQWDVQIPEGLDADGSYLVCANHQSWTDILILQHVFHRKIPFQRFFLKQELFYVPLLGLAWWALDFPFMKRYSKEYLQRHPEKRGQDLATTRRACERFRGTPISILNFLEGTRFTPAKHAKQKSPFKNLLTPKTGGVAFVLEAMGTQFKCLIDVTIVYPHGVVTFGQLLCGRLKKVVVRAHVRPIPASILQGKYLEDENFRQQMQEWVKQIWQEKDLEISGIG